MAIGTTVKVGFDASAVRAGMGGLKGLFSGAMRGMRQVGIGAARQIGAGATDLLGRIVMAIPQGVKETMDWAGNLTDMSSQTGVSVSKLVLLEEALRLAGAEAKDSSRMISMLADNLNNARDEAGPARDALNKLGFLAEEFADVPIDKAFEMIGKRAAALPKDFRGLEGIMADLFGAKMGFKLIRFFKDFNGGMSQAENNVGRFAREIEQDAAGFDEMSDAIGRTEMRTRMFMASFARFMSNKMGSDWVDKLFDKLTPEKLESFFDSMSSTLANFFEKGVDFNGVFRNIGLQIGEGIMESMKSISPASMIKGMFGGGPTAATSGRSEEVGPRIDRSNALLQRIVEKKGGWA